MKAKSSKKYWSLIAGSLGFLSVLSIALLSGQGLMAVSNGGSITCADVTFGTTQYTEAVEGSGTSFFTAKNLTVASSACTKIFTSGTTVAARVGSSTTNGSLTLTFGGSYVITKAKVLCYKYTSDSSKTVSAFVSTSAHSAAQSQTIAATAAPDITDASTDAGYVFTNLDNGTSSASTSFTIAGSGGRFNLCKIVFTIGGSTISSSSSSFSSSATPSSSSSSVNSSSSASVSSTSSSSTSNGEGAYYSSIDWSSSGANLKTSLFNLISSNYVTKSYDYAYTTYLTSDCDSDGKIIDMYSNYHWDPVSDRSGSYTQEGQVFNREHTIPQSVFDEASPMKSDVHHLVPTDGYVNNRRSNYPHGNVGTATYTSGNGSKLGSGSSSTNHGYTSTVFEVIDEYKGDFARMYFYMTTRYQDKLTSWGSFGAFNNTTYPSLSNWARQVYLEWSDADPVSSKEIARNNAIYAVQNNRNPFIDHPEAAHSIWDGAAY